jgi:hypothetical protein
MLKRNQAKRVSTRMVAPLRIQHNLQRQQTSDKMKVIIDKVWRSIRRKYYYSFKQEYIKESIKTRKGICNWQDCKGCCRELIIKCNLFEESTGKCKEWEHPEKMNCNKQMSIDYPFDEKDKCAKSKNKCTYYWEN